MLPHGPRPTIQPRMASDSRKQMNVSHVNAWPSDPAVVGVW